MRGFRTSIPIGFVLYSHRRFVTANGVAAALMDAKNRMTTKQAKNCRDMKNLPNKFVWFLRTGNHFTFAK